MSNLPKRKYGLRDADLSQFTINAIGFLTRDLTDLEEFGITAARIAELEDLQEQFEVFPTDGQKIAQIQQVVIVKNTKRAEIEEIAGFIRTRAENAFKNNVGFYNDFEFEGLANQDDNTFASHALGIGTCAAKYQTQLAAFGQTAAKTTAYTAEVNGFQALLKDVSAAKADRTETARARITLGNQMYELLVELCSFAQSFYAKRNPAKFQDYIIYADANIPKTPPGAPTIEIVDDYAELIFTEDVTSAEMFKRSNPSDTWEQILDGDNAPVFVGTISGTLYIQGRGRNDAGWGPMASKTIIATMGSPSNLRFVDGTTLWDNAPGTEYSELHASYDNGVTFQEVGVIVGPGIYVWPPPSGTVVLRVRNCAGEVKGPWVVITVVIP